MVGAAVIDHFGNPDSRPALCDNKPQPLRVPATEVSLGEPDFFAPPRYAQHGAYPTKGVCMYCSKIAALSAQRWFYRLFLGFYCLGVAGIAQAADLSMNISASPNAAARGQNLTYTVTLFPVAVGTSRSVNDVVFSYGVPPDFTVVSAVAGSGSCQTGEIIECALGDLSGAQTVTLVLTPAKTGTVTSTFFAAGTKLDENTDDLATTKATVVVTTTVSEPPPIELDFSQETVSIRENENLVTISVTRTGEDDRALSVNYSTTDGTAQAGKDYTASSGTLVWAAGEKTPKTFTIAIINDREAERLETVNLLLSDPVSASLGRKNAVLQITDDETTGLIEFSTVTYRVAEEAGKALITVQRNGGADTAITVNYRSSNGSALAGVDYVATTGSLYWSDTDNSPKTFEVEILKNPLITGDRTVTLLLSAADETLLGQRTATLSIVDQIAAEDAVIALEKVARNPTQRALAGTVGRLCQSGQASSDLQARCRELVVNAAIEPEQVATALQQWAPEEYASMGRMSVEFSSRQFRHIGTRLMALRGGAAGGELKLDDLKVDIQGVPLPTNLGEPVSGQAIPGMLPPGIAHKYDLLKLGAYISGDMSFGDRDTTDREAGFDFRSNGVTAGLDYRFKDNLILGAALGYGKAKSDLYNGGQIQNESYALSLYMTFYEPKQFYVDGIYNFSSNSYDTQRNIYYRVADTQVNQTASATPGGETSAITVTGGYQFHYGLLEFTPTLRFDYLRADVDSFRESLSRPFAVGGELGVALDNQSLTSMTLAVGGIAAYKIDLPWAKLIPEVSVELIQEMDNSARSLSGYFVHDASGQRFILPTDNPDTSYFSLSLGMDMEYGDGQTAFITYQSLLGLGGMQHSSIMGGFKLEF